MSFIECNLLVSRRFGNRSCHIAFQLKIVLGFIDDKPTQDSYLLYKELEYEYNIRNLIELEIIEFDTCITLYLFFFQIIIKKSN
jgi:hypothetical protein